MYPEEPRLRPPEYPRGSEGGDDFDFDDNTIRDEDSMGGGRGGNIGSGMGGGYGGVNPHFRHTAIGGGDAGDLAQEKEELDLRGRVLQE